MSSLVLLFTAAIAVANTCPTGDIFAYKLDAYSLVLPSGKVRFRLIEDDGSIVNPALNPWQTFLEDCGAPVTLSASVEWEESWMKLVRLGKRANDVYFWNRFKIRREIRELERAIALQYASLLRSLELETGIAVRWNVDEHWLADGMISTARGSDRVYDYIDIVYASDASRVVKTE